jgi:hypothetical protein
MYLPALRARCDVLETTCRAVYWIEDGQEKRALIATVDHIEPVANGGGNGDNIVPACYDCNQRRTKHRRSERNSLYCKKCGGPKEQPRRRKCNRCRFGNGMMRP